MTGPVGYARPDVHFWAADKAGCGFYRCEEPGRVLRMLGYQVVVDTLRTPAWQQHAVVGQRVCDTRPTVGWQQLAADRDKRRVPAQLVYDVDDDLFAVDERSPAHGFFARPDIRANIVRNAQVADVVTCATSVIADRMRAETGHRDIRVIGNGLPAALSGWTRPAHRGPLGDMPAVTLGWTGSALSAPDLAVAAPAIRRILDRNPRWRLHTIGAPVGAVEAVGLAHPQVDVTEWIPGTLEFLARVDFDVWVAPWRDTPFNRAKWPTKIMESRMLGIPLVVTPVGAYADRGNHDAGVFTAREAHEWQHHLWRLGSDRAARAVAGDAARSNAYRWFTERVGLDWMRALGLAT